MGCTWFHGASGREDLCLTHPLASRTIDFEPISRERDMRVTPTVVFVSGCLLVVTTASSAQSLADVARKEEARRKAQPPATKVYTNKDLGDAPPATAPPAPTSSSAGSTPSSSAETATKDDKSAKGDAAKGDAAKGEAPKGEAPKGEAKGDASKQAYWADRMKTARETLDHDSTFVDALQSRVNALTTDFVNRDDPAQRATIEADRQKAMSELARMKQKVVEDRKAISDIEEDARRAGVPAGWVR